MVGTQIEAFAIQEQIGEGGMGVVYKALDTNIDRTVAIKVLAPEFARNPALLTRFRAEAKAQGNLLHPNIAVLYSFLQTDNQCLIVMEYLQGETFERRLAREKKIPWKEAAALMQQALSGFGFAHKQGVIHRDIKPANLMLTLSGNVKIMDFGIAKALGSPTKTRTGVYLGTPFYTSPEQVQGDPVDARSDIYSLGVTLYQMLTGYAPFTADTDMAVMYAHVHTPPPPFGDDHREIPREIEQCVMKALAKKPADRFQTTEEFASALRQVSEPRIYETRIEVHSAVEPKENQNPEPKVRDATVVEPPAEHSSRLKAESGQNSPTLLAKYFSPTVLVLVMAFLVYFFWKYYFKEWQDHQLQTNIAATDQRLDALSKGSDSLSSKAMNAASEVREDLSRLAAWKPVSMDANQQAALEKIKPDLERSYGQLEELWFKADYFGKYITNKQSEFHNQTATESELTSLNKDLSNKEELLSEYQGMFQNAIKQKQEVETREDAVVPRPILPIIGKKPSSSLRDLFQPHLKSNEKAGSTATDSIH